MGPSDRGRWRHGWGPPRRRPRWWPENEPWPPQGPEAWRTLQRGFIRRAALFIGFVLLLLFVLAVAFVWLVTRAFGTGFTSAILTIILLLVLAMVAARVVRAIRLAVAPMSDLIAASARVEAGELGTRVPERGPREMRALARSFNAMSARLAETDAERRRLLADVSHELRTPLTVIQGNVEGILDGLYPADRPHLERILAETQQMERLIDDLRTLSLADAGALVLHREPTDLGALVDEVVAGFAPQAEAAGVALVAETPAGLADIEVDPLRVRQIVTNLVSNALRHTPRDGRISVATGEETGWQTLTVADTGAGMDADAAAHAFERFWRSSDSAGAGLGLAIVRDLLVAHGGTVALASEPGSGTTVTCRLPIHGAGGPG